MKCKGDVSTLTITDINRIRKNIHHAQSSIILSLPKKNRKIAFFVTNLVKIKINKEKIVLVNNNKKIL